MVVQDTGGSWEEVEWLEYILPPDTEATNGVGEEPTDQGHQDQKDVEEDGSASNLIEEEANVTRFSDVVNNAPLLLNKMDEMKGKEPYKQIQIASGGLVILRPSPSSQESRTPVKVSEAASALPSDPVSVNMNIDGRGHRDEVPMEVGDVSANSEVNNNDLDKGQQAEGEEQSQQEDRRHEQALPQHEADAGGGQEGDTEQEVNNNESRRPKTRKKYTAPSAGGQRRALLLACADNVPENRSVLNSFLEALQIWTIEEEMIIVGDCKIINLLMGKSKQ